MSHRPACHVPDRAAGSALVGAAAALAAAAGSAAAPPAFSAQSAAAGVAVNHSTSGVTLTGYTGGACIGDFNRDGWPDLFFISGGNGSKPDYLFINNKNGTFTNRAAEWGLTAIHKGKGASITDFDGDGWPDLYVTSAGPAGQAEAVGHHKLYHNNGNGTFTDVAAAAGVATVHPTLPNAWGSCWGDYDHDGDLDLMVGGFSTSNPNNSGNRLFRNNGDGTFTNVTTTIGLFNGMGAIANFSQRFIDMDGDRWPELLMVGDFKNAGFIGSRYFKNDGDGTFTDLTVSSHAGAEENGMGHCVGDVNNDGRIDWYATSIYSPSIGWTGNKLYRNVGPHNFTEFSGSAGCFDGGYGWGSVIVDFNHDGWSDIAETNGDDASGGQFFNEQSYLWMNDGDGTFTEMAIPSGLIHYGKGRCMLNFDYDLDGDQDVVICTNNGPLSLFRNDLDHNQPDTHWLRIVLDTRGAPGVAPDGFGSKVVVTANGKTFARSIDGGSTFLGVPELSAHFGLGAVLTVNQVKVEWPDGMDTVLTNVPVDQHLSIKHPHACVADLTGDAVVDGADLGMLIAAWGGHGRADLNLDGHIDGGDLGILLAGWGACP